MTEKKTERHRLLRRQLRRAGIPDTGAAPTQEQWEALLERIEAAYKTADRDRYLIERRMQVSGEEMRALNARVGAERSLLSSVLGSLSTAVLHIDRGGEIRFVNNAGQKMLGMSPEDFGAPGSSHVDLRWREGQRLGWEHILQVMETGQMLVQDEMFLARRDSTTLPVSVSINPISGSEDVDGVVMTLNDLSNQRRAEEAAEQAHIEAMSAERARRAQQTFLANMSHELRTPLNAVLGYAELAIEESEELGYDEVLPDMRKLERAAHHLLGLINDVLDMSKIQAGHLQLELAEHDLGQMLEEVRDTLVPKANEKGNIIELARSGPLLVRTDALRMRQCLLNLTSNACKFTHEGHVMLEAHSRDDHVELVVRDDGIGMDELTQARVFDEFVQASASTQRRYGGTGLGLAITRKLCQMMHTTIELESTPGEGTAFTLRIPIEFRG